MKLLEEAVQLAEGRQLSLEPGSGGGVQRGGARPGNDRLKRGTSGSRDRLWAEHDSVNSKEPIQQGSWRNRWGRPRWRSSFNPPVLASRARVSAVLLGGPPIGLTLGILRCLVTTHSEEP